MNIEARLDTYGEIITSNPPRRTGPVHVKLAIRAIVHHRPLAEEVSIRTIEGDVFTEEQIIALFEICRLPH